jgi:hypothetical protein
MTYPQSSPYEPQPRPMSAPPTQPFYGGPTAPYPPAPPVGGWPAPKKPHRWPHVVGYVGTALVALLIGVAAGSGAKTTTTNAAGVQPATTVTAVVTYTPVVPVPPTPSAPTKPTTPPKPTPKPSPSVDDGGSDVVVVVGDDIPPGRYQVRNAPGDCYWKIFHTGRDDIISNNIGGGHQVVTLKSGQSFETQGCGVWVKF